MDVLSDGGISAYKFAGYLSYFTSKKKEKREKKKKESHDTGGLRVLSRFFEKILPDVGGVEIFLKTRRA